ncbi:MAG: NAD+ synthase [Deltaproteobacteria bacterium]|nr:NAD+ synthase [Deltaproteobacteria bacterium]
MRTLRLAMAQINPTVGALSRNAAKIYAYAMGAQAKGAEVVLFPELAITGYPPEDLLLKPGFVRDNVKAVNELARRIRGITAVVGFVDGNGGIFNAAAIIHDGRIAGISRKMHLPNYGVFDEKRYFTHGTRPLNVRLGHITFGVEICEDIWRSSPIKAQSEAGADLIVNINASPYHAGKTYIREELLARRARENNVTIAYDNMVGGQDELVFDGQGMVVDRSGKVVARAKAFEEDLLIVDLEFNDKGRAARKINVVETITLEALKRAKDGVIARRRLKPLPEHSQEVLQALLLGVRDYVSKNGFKQVCIGLSGGIDSALVAAIAVKALGAKNVIGVFMPSMYTSPESRVDAFLLAKNLGINLIELPINGLCDSYSASLKEVFVDRPPNIAEENIQARIRGNLLMALSNKFGYLVLTTGNKSEMSVGYATLYGDMAGGFAVIKDLPKTLVYDVATRINESFASPVIPERVFTKPPTAELKPGQTDQDSLPPYDLLDNILKAYVEDDLDVEEIAALGFKRKVVMKVVRLVDASEYKRRQAPPGIKITPRALGKDRRMPITNGYGVK